MNLVNIYTALITPFDQDEQIDYTAFTKLLKKQYEAGIRGFLISGTTGESPVLNFEEKKSLVMLAKSLYRDISIMLGVGGNDTKKSLAEIEAFNAMEEIDAYLCVAPYYNRPSQKGLYEHFMALDQATVKPMILYNVPKRCGIEIEPITIASLLVDSKHIVGLKHASDRLETLTIVKQMVPEAILFAGDDHALYESLYHGADGVISVVSHLIPHSIMQMVEHFDLLPNLEPLDDYIKMIAKYCFIESSPSPVKYLLSKQGLIQNVLRLPLVPLSQENQEILDLLLENDVFH